MGRNIVSTNEAPAPPPTYSQAVKAGGLVFVSGIGPFEAATGKVLGETIEEQPRQCLTNRDDPEGRGKFAREDCQRHHHSA